MNSITRGLALLAFLCLAGQAADAAAFRLAPLFTDSMVVQQQTRVPFWGTGQPGRQITVRATWGRSATAAVSPDGSWHVLLPTPKAGGPFSVEVTDGDSVHLLRNVLSGEVWLCSGQSNMEMPLNGFPPSDTIAGAAGEIRRAPDSLFRMFTVNRASSPVRRADCGGHWVQATPGTVARFSATGYYFGRKLQQELHVPIGLINSSWGGTPIEAWMDSTTLAGIPEMDTTLAKVASAGKDYQKLLQWLSTMPSIDMRGATAAAPWKNLHFQDDSCASVGFDDSRWRMMNLPGLWESTWLGDFDGVVWFRRSVEIPPAWRKRDLTLALGPIDDMDATFVNGVRVGSMEEDGMYKVNRVYPVSAAVAADSVLEIAVRVIDTGGGGGIWGGKGSMVLFPAGGGDSLSLEGPWKCLPVAEYVEGVVHIMGASGEKYSERPPVAISVGPNTPTMLFNGMIAPLAPFAIRGAIWYQGESNTRQPALYERLFPAMIGGWRRAFNEPSMPFYFVQIAPYVYDVPSQLLRDAQRKTLAVPNTGMAVTMDIGNALNIHPSNKKAVGDRLARWALAKTYGKQMPYSGPLLKSATFRRGAAELRFDHAGKTLVILQGPMSNGFQIAGADSVFRDADVAVRGDMLVVSNPAIAQPLAVRYAFSNTPAATLFNSDGLPASSFRTDAWPR